MINHEVEDPFYEELALNEGNKLFNRPLAEIISDELGGNLEIRGNGKETAYGITFKNQHLVLIQENRPHINPPLLIPSIYLRTLPRNYPSVGVENILLVMRHRELRTIKFISESPISYQEVCIFENGDWFINSKLKRS